MDKDVIKDIRPRTKVQITKLVCKERTASATSEVTDWLTMKAQVAANEQAEIQSKLQIATMELNSKEKLADASNKHDLQKTHIEYTGKMNDTALKAQSQEHIAQDRNDADMIIATIDNKNQLGHPHI